ncbi:hypothetical protein RclHR1_07870005 [Rhizophagus clarus]|uniref:Uncharacterized protein n=1 Tax=Rhizophagus clarus TaxID=94130 RepID=A0A2Z6SE54_9GLOM|nr:hypothetical protein RclHR1_07870005 [Rhizophagus clarus]GET04083.1 hypothetical protein RCL_jg24411.t1 [Rhizophagus clarus]
MSSQRNSQSSNSTPKEDNNQTNQSSIPSPPRSLVCTLNYHYQLYLGINMASRLNWNAIFGFILNFLAIIPSAMLLEFAAESGIYQGYSSLPNPT